MPSPTFSFTLLLSKVKSLESKTSIPMPKLRIVQRLTVTPQTPSTSTPAPVKSPRSPKPLQSKVTPSVRKRASPKQISNGSDETTGSVAPSSFVVVTTVSPHSHGISVSPGGQNGSP